MKLKPTRGIAATLLAACLAGGALTACVPVALVGGAVGAGALLTQADRRSGETQQADGAIESAAREAVTQALGGRGHVNVASYFRKVLITGEVPTAQDKQTVEAAVRAAPGVQSVVNELAVMPESGAMQRSSDAYVSSKVRSRMVGTNGVPSGSIKVVTERGTTYLMGRLTAQELAAATDVARQTDGVQRVVRVVDLIADPTGAGGLASGTGQQPSAVQQTTGAAPLTPVSGESVPGVETHPVTQPTIVNAPQPIQVQTLPPVK
ncbi:BON domain-containing protein [Ottowia sp. SB7-C50]|uniref:BON domain-containing protein n=1 Tax=Ottowia sp. SB7-C50 TaxID=3081231 RepID=UPI002952A5AA|nr:BON domain-containing protein [Ottowia sp. SB7-C50]WOP15253.1 BON domain-containing protein [Ottowia sp. SB7-C50]